MRPAAFSLHRQGAHQGAKMVEIRRAFSSIAEWRDFRASLPEIATISAAVVADVQKHGFIEPLTGAQRQPADIIINPKNLHESISAHELNSRKRALDPSTLERNFGPQLAESQGSADSERRRADSAGDDPARPLSFLLRWRVPADASRRRRNSSRFLISTCTPSIFPTKNSTFSSAATCSSTCLSSTRR